VKKLRILIADDHELVRAGIRGVLKHQHAWRVVGEAVNGREAVEKAKTQKPDLVIIDVSMPELDGLQATRQILEAVPNTKVVVLTMHESGQMVHRALGAGARGFVSKSDLAASLLKAVADVSEGRRFLTSKISEIVLEEFLRTANQPVRTVRLQCQPTVREVEIIRLLAEGKSTKEIAPALGITVRTVETHRAKIMLKLGLHSLAELIHYAIRNKIVSVPSASD
jgi:DNA-binding NarL/FixJ family response regulator